jgi:hypothetical protein
MSPRQPRRVPAGRPMHMRARRAVVCRAEIDLLELFIAEALRFQQGQHTRRGCTQHGGQHGRLRRRRGHQHGAVQSAVAKGVGDAFAGRFCMAGPAEGR